MEPVDYLKILKNHWKAVAALVLLAMAAAFVISPSTSGKAYSAEHVLRLEGADAESAASTVAVDALLTETDEVLERVRGESGFDGSARELKDKVEATVDPNQLPLLRIKVTDADPDQAIALANTFGTELIDYMDERERQRVEDDLAEAAETAVRLEREIADLDAQIATNPPNVEDLRDERAVKERQRNGLVFSEETATETSNYATVTPATEAQTEASFVSGLGRAQRMLFGAVVGAVVGFGVAIMLDRSDSRLRTKEQAEKHFGVPVLAEIPLLAIRDRSRAAVVAFEGIPQVAEAYRGLRTALLLFRNRRSEAADRGPAAVEAANGNGTLHSAPTNGRHHVSGGPVRQLVVVTSPEAGDGKSTTVANLAMAYAETGQSVLLVSWDLWRPLSPEVFDAQEGPGVSDYLDGHGSSLVRYVQDTSIPGVRIVTAGLGGHHPAAQIEAARRLLEEARTLANVVIVDTAPILSTSVTRELATLADAVVIVCRSGRTTGHAADRCAELLERLGAPTLGVVLVGVPTGPFADYYGPAPKRRFASLERGRRRGSGHDVEHTGPRHKASGPRAASRSSTRGSGSSLRPTAAQYRAATPRSETEGGRESTG